MAGVTSWGLGCGRSWTNNALENKQGSPGIFTDLSKVLPWIYEHIQTGNELALSKEAPILAGLREGTGSVGKTDQRADTLHPLVLGVAHRDLKTTVN